MTGPDPDCDALVRRAAARLREVPPDLLAAHATIRWLREQRLAPEPRQQPWRVHGPALAAGLALTAAIAAALALVDQPHPSSEPTAAQSHDVRDVAFVLHAPGAERVALVGDFNEWDSGTTSLVRTGNGGIWTTTITLPAGRHVYAFVVNDSAWVADPYAPSAPESSLFGEPSSVVVVATEPAL